MKMHRRRMKMECLAPVPKPFLASTLIAKSRGLEEPGLERLEGGRWTGELEYGVPESRCLGGAGMELLRRQKKQTT